MRMWCRAMGLAVVLLSTNGCASSLGHLFGPCPYVGVQLDAKSWDVAGPLIFLDMPFSAVMDTVLLPLDLASGRSCSGW